MMMLLDMYVIFLLSHVLSFVFEWFVRPSSCLKHQPDMDYKFVTFLYPYGLGVMSKISAHIVA